MLLLANRRGLIGVKLLRAGRLGPRLGRRLAQVRGPRLAQLLGRRPGLPLGPRLGPRHAGLAVGPQLLLFWRAPFVPRLT